MQMASFPPPPRVTFDEREIIYEYIRDKFNRLKNGYPPPPIPQHLPKDLIIAMFEAWDEFLWENIVEGKVMFG